MREVQAFYGASHVLQGVTLDVPRGAVTAIVGRNGVGKTTLINAIMGLVPASGGSIRASGRELVGLPAYRRREVGLALVPQGRRLFRSLTVEEHLDLVPPLRPGPVDREWVMERFPRLRERRAASARTLSGGEQSMLAIARAIVLNPDVLLMDEPTEGLAPLLVEEVRGVVGSLREGGMTILLVEQNLGFALAVADRVAVMERGVVARVVPRGTIGDAAALGELVLGTGGSRES
jgi:branched-chain amino acid transport system ATP-binding protein